MTIQNHSRQNIHSLLKVLEEKIWYNSYNRTFSHRIFKAATLTSVIDNSSYDWLS